MQERKLINNRATVTVQMNNDSGSSWSISSRDKEKVYRFKIYFGGRIISA